MARKLFENMVWSFLNVKKWLFGGVETTQIWSKNGKTKVAWNCLKWRENIVWSFPNVKKLLFGVSRTQKFGQKMEKPKLLEIAWNEEKIVRKYDRKRFALVAEGNHCSRLIFGLQSTAKIWAKFTSKHKSLNLPSTISKIVTFWSRNAIFFNFEDFKECYIILKFSYWNAHIGYTFPLKSTIFIVFLIILIYNLQLFKASSLQSTVFNA